MDEVLRNWFLSDGPPSAGPQLEHGTAARRRRRLSPRPEEREQVGRPDASYARQFQDEEMALHLKQMAEATTMFRRAEIRESGMDMPEPDFDANNGDVNPLVEESLRQRASSYEVYDFNITNRQPLAIDSQKEAILQLLKSERAIVVKGFTGCGKTTRVPQFILDSCLESKVPCNIVVTQPRRIAAISIAKRVCQERNWDIGTVVGYQVGMDRKGSCGTCLTYMTTGCLLESLVAKKSLDEYTHIVIDEVHERDEDTDLLLLVVRRFMRLSKCTTKLVLMSATVEAGKFAEYLTFSNDGHTVDRAPIVDVNEERPFSVIENYLDELSRMSYLKAFIPHLQGDVASPKIDENSYQLVARLIASFDEKREICRHGRLDDRKHLSTQRGAVLVFLPGLGEIETMHKHLLMVDEETDPARKNHWLILPLHSRIGGEEQSRVFQIPPAGCRKIILSTNIAESSITVPDIVYVIDFCLTKQLMVDPQTNFSTLTLGWAPRSNCVQRKGRVGRVNDGVVFRIVSKKFYHEELPEDVTPEMLRCPMEHTILRLKLLDMGPPKSLLGLALDPPKDIDITKTINTLKEAGALHLTTTVDDDWKLDAYDGDLSYLGRVVARLPIDIHLGRLVMLGYIYNVLDESIIIAAGLGSKSIFTSPMNLKLKSYQIKMAWAEGSFSDPIAILNAYQVWKSQFRPADYRTSGPEERKREYEWARSKHMQLKSLKDMDCLVKEIGHRLKMLGIEPPTGPNVRRCSSMEKAFLLRVVLFGAFYPHYFSRHKGQIDERNAVKELCGWSPYNTVKLNGWKNDQPGKAYIQKLKRTADEMLAAMEDDSWNVQMKFDSSRAFIQFHQEGVSSQRMHGSRIAAPVYYSVKQRLLQNKNVHHDRHFYCVNYLNANRANYWAQKIEEKAKAILESPQVTSFAPGEGAIPFVLQIPPARLPKVGEWQLIVAVIHSEDPSRFWIQRYDDIAGRDYKQMALTVGPAGCRLSTRQPLHSEIVKGSLFMGPYPGETTVEYYRARVVARLPNGLVKIHFIDFGNSAEVSPKDLRYVLPELLCFQPLAMECHLTAVGPSQLKDLRGEWSKEAKEFFTAKTVDRQAVAKVFSVVNGIISLDLCPAPSPESVADPNPDWEQSIAKEMVRQEHAVVVEETYCSVLDSEERLKYRAQNEHVAFKSYQMKEYEEQRKFAAELVASERIDINDQGEYYVALNGPTSPLEMKMYGKVQSLIGTNIKVDEESVNSVLLDCYPEDPHERVLVAAMVSKHPDNNRLTVRQTTLLPAIPGLPSLLTLIFAPRAEFRANANRTQLTGALLGLGKDEKNFSLYPDHDMEIEFDTIITMEDVDIINRIRYWTNTVLGACPFRGLDAAPSVERMREVSFKSIRALFELVAIKRESCERASSKVAYKWNRIDPANMTRYETAEGHLKNLLPIHDCINIISPNVR